MVDTRKVILMSTFLGSPKCGVTPSVPPLRCAGGFRSLYHQTDKDRKCSRCASQEVQVTCKVLLPVIT